MPLPLSNSSFKAKSKCNVLFEAPLITTTLCNAWSLLYLQTLEKCLPPSSQKEMNGLKCNPHYFPL